MKCRLHADGSLKDIAVALDLAQKLSRADVYQALEAGGEIIQRRVQDKVSQQAATHPRGQLEDAISLRRTPGAAAVTVGWEETPMRAKSGRRVMGPRRRSGFTDVNGRHRNVDTVADYGRILEYSETRKLRHMESGAEETSAQAERVIAAQIEKAIARALGASAK